MSEYQLDVDVSSGSYSVDVDVAGNPTPAGERWLNGYELSLANRERWDRLYEMEAENTPFETGYDYAVQVYETVHYKIDAQQIADTKTTTTPDGNQVTGSSGTYQESHTWESSESMAEWDTQAYRDLVHQSEMERTRQETDAGLDVAPTISDVDEVLAEDPPSQTDLLSDPSYIRVVNGWNQKLNASSEDLSGLVPFCELYAVFDQSDIISQEDEFSTRYTSIKNRMIKVKFTGSKRAEGTNSEPPLPSGLSKDCYIVKVAGDNKSQLQSDSLSYDEDTDINTYTTSYKGVPGIGDLAVSRGSAAAQNVKYDLSITLPNPELINERFEYSKLMLMNSPFLIVYGWNIKDSNFNAEYYPPRISTMPGITNEIVVGDGIGGFWSSAIINLSNFSFSFDTVGHLVGKLTFLNSSGIFLGTLSTAAVGQVMLDQISTPSEEVIRRTGGEENQDFIWQNGVPWSATVPDTEEANIQNNREGQRRILTSFFDLESNIGTAATELLETSLSEQNITIELANQIRDNMESLLVQGEHFLQRYRVMFINQLFYRRKRNMGLDSEKAKMQMIIDDTDWKPGERSGVYGFRDSGVGDRGERYGPDGDEDNNSPEADEIIDQHFEYYITSAWNTFFKYRFENMRKDDIMGRIFIGDRSLPMPVIPKVQFPSGSDVVPAGQSQSQFDHFATNGGRTKQITYQIPAGSRAKLLPVALENVINWAAEASGRFGQEDSFIKSMPPFGRELQRIIANDFRDTTNVNYNNFYNPASRKVTEEVLNLIETTSVVSVPVPVSEEDRVSLNVENRSYSEVFGIDPSDGSKASVPLSKDVMIGFEFLNEVVTGGKALSKITFYSNDIFTSLQDTVFDDWLGSEEARVFTDSFASPTARLAAIAAQSDSLVALHGDNSFYSPLSKVVADPSAPYYQGRFAARRYAILKNGWIVAQTRATENDPWKDHGAPQALVVNGEPSGLWFLKDILPDDAVTITGEDLREGESSEETYIYNAEQRIEAIEAKKDELRNDYSNSNREQNADEYAQEEYASLILNKKAVEGIVQLQNAMISASRGSIIMDQVDMGIANQEQSIIEGEDGEQRHTIFRLPVYFFLGSVLESLRVATNDKVKFFYSEVPSSKAAEPFYINIPESSANSVDNYYDAQIANFDRQLDALGAAGWREEEDEEGEIRMVEGGLTLPERQAAELLASQTRWDNFLVDFIKKVGQDEANITGYQPTNFGDSNIDSVYPFGRGVYSNYTNMYGTNVATQLRWPNYQYHRNNRYYEDYGDHKFDADGNIRIWLPWILRLGNKDDYWKGPDGFYQHNPNIGEDKHGFMRIWRPDDLDELVGHVGRGDPVYYRDAQKIKVDEGQFHVSRQQAFYTDSFGKSIPNSRVDYGYADAYNREGDWRDSNAQPNRSFDPERTNGQKAAAGVINWLNWWSPNRARYTNLDSDSHRSYGNNADSKGKWGPPQHPGDRETEPENWRQRTAANLTNGWYEIQWPMERRGDQPSKTEPMWVRGLVVKEFIELNGTRPTQDFPTPNPGEDLLDMQQNLRQIDTLKAQIRDLESKKANGDLDAQFKRLPIRTTYEIPVNISTIKQFLTSEPRAPLHKLLKKVVAAAKETVPAIQLSMRPAAANSSYLDIFPSAMNYDGVIQEIFTEVEVGSLSTDASDTMGIKDARRSVSKGRFAQSEKVMVCQFGTSQSLVESFGLASKIDPNAFSAFRLPAVVGGATMNVIEVLRNARDDNPDAYSTLLSDFGSILSDGIITGKDALKKLKIVNDGTEGASTVNYDNLEAFLLSESPAISKAASTLLEDMMSQNVKLYNTILTMQNEFFTNKMKNEEGTIGEPGPRQAGSKFYGNILSTFLRTATLTIHGTTGLSVFNLVYLKGLLSGIEGLYLISSVNESIAASTFTTTLECKLIEYTNNDPKTNPIAYRGASNLNRLASLIDEAKASQNADFGTDYSWNRLGDVVEQIDNRNGVFD